MKHVTCCIFMSSLAAAESMEAAVEAGADGGSLGRVAADAGVGSFAEDGMATLHGTAFASDDAWRMLLEGRMRLRMLDRGPDEPALRREDWDEPSDFAHILRDFTIEDELAPEGRFEIHVGEHDGATVGHGTIVRDYTNAVDPDHLHAGASVRIEHPWYGFEALVDDVTGPRLVAARASGHPVEEHLSVGATAAFDLWAPESVRENLDGTRSIDGARNLETYGRTLTMVGGDLDVRVADDAVAFTPYVDGNLHFGLGAGLHAGGLVEITPASARLALRGEYRLGSDGYIPAYADALYDLTRLQFTLAAPERDPATQRAAADAGGFGGHGFLAEASVEAKRMKLAGGFSRRPGPEGNLLGVRLDVPTGRRVVVGARWLHRAIGQTPGLEGAVVGAGVRVMLSKAIYATSDYARLFLLDPSGVFAPIHVATIGVGGMLSF
ncbi:MAG: hypothetical protein AABZ30_09860 [Myxococcota bacterium]